MNRLQRVLATSVLEALRARDHVVVAPASADALCDEVEAIIAPALADITAPTEATFAAATKRRATQNVVSQIADRLLESDHVDDIHADDRVIRRDAFRAIRDILLGYIRGEIDVDDGRDDFAVRLDGLGYVVSAVARQLEPEVLRDTLVRAANAVGGRLLWFDAPYLAPSFHVPGGAEVGRLAVEEAITEELVLLVHADVVALPAVEQVLELTPETASAPGFAEAVSRAELRTRSETGCAAGCELVDRATLIATLVPLSEDAAAEIQELFTLFVGNLELELAMLPAPPMVDEAADKPPSARRRKQSSSRKTPRAGSPASPSRGGPSSGTRHAAKGAAEKDPPLPSGRRSRTRSSLGGTGDGSPAPKRRRRAKG
jgi:hypothetical protein